MMAVLCLQNVSILYQILLLNSDNICVAAFISFLMSFFKS